MNVIWIKSSHSFSNGNCVEVAFLPGGEIGIRNSRDPGGPVLTFTPGEWAAFVSRASAGNCPGPLPRVSAAALACPAPPEMSSRYSGAPRAG